MHSKIHKVNILDRCLIKYERRLKRLGFVQYIQKVDLVNEEIEGDKRGLEMRALIGRRQLERLFGRFKSHLEYRRRLKD